MNPHAMMAQRRDSGALTEVQCDQHGNLHLPPGTNVHSSALEKSKVVSTAACVLRSAKAFNNGGSDAYLMVFDATSLPGNGTIPARVPVLVPAGSMNGDVWAGGTSLATGCVLALSSTLASLTLIASNDGFFDAEID